MTPHALHKLLEIVAKKCEACPLRSPLAFATALDDAADAITEHGNTCDCLTANHWRLMPDDEQQDLVRSLYRAFTRR